MYNSVTLFFLFLTCSVSFLDFPSSSTNDFLLAQLYIIPPSVGSFGSYILHKSNLSLKEPGLSWELVFYKCLQLPLFFFFFFGCRCCEPAMRRIRLMDPLKFSLTALIMSYNLVYSQRWIEQGSHECNWFEYEEAG